MILMGKKDNDDLNDVDFSSEILKAERNENIF